MGFIYKKYVLRPKSIHLSESDRWTLQVTVVVNQGSEGEAREQTFSTEDTFSIKEMADVEGVIFARKIIDGEINGLSIDDKG